MACSLKFIVHWSHGWVMGSISAKLDISMHWGFDTQYKLQTKITKSHHVENDYYTMRMLVINITQIQNFHPLQTKVSEYCRQSISSINQLFVLFNNFVPHTMEFASTLPVSKSIIA